MTLRCVSDWSNFSHEFFFGEEVTFRSVTEDSLNFYAHGVNSESPPGYHSNYLTLPKYAFVRVEEGS